MNNQKMQIKKKVKKHIPKDWLCELRILYRIALETFNDIKRTGIVNLVIVTTMAAILIIFGTFFRTTLSISTFAHELGNVLEISVYIKQDTDANYAKKSIKDIDHVESIRIIPKSVSWTNLQREMNLPNIDNPLPDTLHVKVDKPENIEFVFNKIKMLSVVEDVSYAQDLVKKIDKSDKLLSNKIKLLSYEVIK